MTVSYKPLRREEIASLAGSAALGVMPLHLSGTCVRVTKAMVLYWGFTILHPRSNQRLRLLQWLTINQTIIPTLMTMAIYKIPQGKGPAVKSLIDQ